MNFLAHYYFDRQDHNPYFHLGLLMPDLIRNFISNGKKFIWPVEFPDLELLQIRKGALQHESRDLFFHSSPGFVQITTHLIQVLRKTGLPFKRDWFIAHVFAELMLDRMLLIRHPNLAKALYDQLEACDLMTISKLFGTQEQMKSEFEKGYERFITHKYLETYAREESIAYAMGRIAARVDIHILESHYQEALACIVRTEEKECLTFMDYLENAFQNS